MEPMVVMAANAAKKVGHEILRAHQNRHRLDLAVESKGLMVWLPKLTVMLKS